MQVARNALCPCGSGLKCKLCCGTTREQERELARLSRAFDEIAGLATAFPRLRPTGSAFSAWADRVASEETEATMEEGIALIEPGERARIAGADDEGSATIWQSFFAELGDNELVARAMVTGAVAAAVRERLPPQGRPLEALEEFEELRSRPCTVLTCALDSGSLWSLHESAQADAALAALPEELDDYEYEQRWDEIMSAEAARLKHDVASEAARRARGAAAISAAAGRVAGRVGGALGGVRRLRARPRPPGRACRRVARGLP